MHNRTVLPDPNASAPTCTTGEIAAGYDRHGADIGAVPASSAIACAVACCKLQGCAAYVFAPLAPAKFGACVPGQPCCYPKDAAVAPSKSRLPGIVTGTVAQNSPSPPPAPLIPPPTGMRSAVPLGGIGAGSFELRGDGTFTQFTIWNNFPAAAPKFGAFPHALFGLRVAGEAHPFPRAMALQTSPPAGIAGVDSLRYSGAYPVSRLSPTDPARPAHKHVLRPGLCSARTFNTTGPSRVTRSL